MCSSLHASLGKGEAPLALASQFLPMLQQATYQAVEVNGTNTTGILNVTLAFGNIKSSPS